MLEIHAEIVEIIEADSTMDNLLGATTSDTRIYSWNPSEDIIYSSSKKGAIFYREAVGKRPPRWSYPKQFSNSTLFFKVVGINQTITNQIGERLIDLFDLGTVETTNWRIATVELLSYNDSIPEGSPTNTQWTKMVTFMFSNIFKK
jgi:hypothetical protein